MHWQGEFRAALFGAWTDAGLPDPGDHVAHYRAAVAGTPCPLDLPYAASGPLHRGVVDRVYGFGAVIGSALGEILGVRAPHADPAAAWCARFNLGISLVDYVCDESGRVDVLESLEPFRSLANSTVEPPGDLRDEEAAVAGIAIDLLLELADLPEGGAPSGAIADLYRSEVAIARRRPARDDDLAAIESALSAKSAGPFVLMAARVAAGNAHADPGPARSLGAAIGTLFWLVDDAQDLWLDLARDSWNLFLLRVAEIDPAIPIAPPTPFRDAAIVRSLRDQDIARREAEAAVGSLVAALGATPVHKAGAAGALGLVGAALAVW